MTTGEWVYGRHTVTTLLKTAPQRLLQIYITAEKTDQTTQQFLALAAQHNVPVRHKSRKELEQLLPGVQHQGIAAECQKSKVLDEADLEYLLENLQDPPLLLILDGVQDPHNLGACLRTANAAGVHAVIIPADRSVGLTAVARKVACGAAELTPLIQVTNLARTLRTLQSKNIWLVGGAAESEATIYDVDLQGGIALVLGAEGAGLRQLTRQLCDYLVTIPMHGAVESLNVSVATGIFLFEALRQRVYTKSVK